MPDYLNNKSKMITSSVTTSKGVKGLQGILFDPRATSALAQCILFKNQSCHYRRRKQTRYDNRNSDKRDTIIHLNPTMLCIPTVEYKAYTKPQKIQSYSTFLIQIKYKRTSSHQNILQKRREDHHSIPIQTPQDQSHKQRARNTLYCAAFLAFFFLFLLLAASAI